MPASSRRRTRSSLSVPWRLVTARITARSKSSVLDTLRVWEASLTRELPRSGVCPWRTGLAVDFSGVREGDAGLEVRNQRHFRLPPPEYRGVTGLPVECCGRLGQKNRLPVGSGAGEW